MIPENARLDVQQEIDKYRNEVTQLARPLPVEYLLIDIPAAFPVEQKFTFHAGNSVKPFPVENRASAGEVQVSAYVDV